jgi:hypothetical protein
MVTMGRDDPSIAHEMSAWLQMANSSSESYVPSYLIFFRRNPRVTHMLLVNDNTGALEARVTSVENLFNSMD